jgi:hypothetical protein
MTKAERAAAERQFLIELLKRARERIPDRKANQQLLAEIDGALKSLC